MQVSLYFFFPLELIWDGIFLVTWKMVRKVITNLDSSKASGPDCNPVVVLDCEPEFSPALAERFNNCLKESRFLDC